MFVTHVTQSIYHIVAKVLVLIAIILVELRVYCHSLILQFFIPYNSQKFGLSATVYENLLHG